MSAQLVVHPDGDTLRLGALFKPDADWHVYWKNSGDSGLATQVTWTATLPDGTSWTSKEMTWPTPKVFVVGGGMVTTFGYDDVLHAVKMPLPASLEAGQQITLSARLNYLTCKVECIPGDQVLSTVYTVGQEPDEEVALLFKTYDKKIPVPSDSSELPIKVRTQLSQSAMRVGDEGVWRIIVSMCDEECVEWKPYTFDGDEHTFLPELADGVVLNVKSLTWGDEHSSDMIVDVGWRVTSTQAMKGDVELAGVLKMHDEEAKLRSFRVVSAFPLLKRDASVTLHKLPTISVNGEDNQKLLGLSDVLGGQAEEPQEEPPTFLYALWLAFIGGMLLNVMPCVFPVLSIKITGIAQIAQHDRSQMVRHGLAYTGGIMSAMGALTCAVLLMRQLGVEVGWGFQFQSPMFLLVLLGTLTLFAVNLFGAFDIGTPMGSEMQDILNAEHSGLKQSFLEGLLCVMLATPCTAPFMGTAVGFALTSPSVVVASIFLMLGFGLALPFLVLCAMPGWTSLLPKPGGWLDVLKHMLGLGLLGTCVWLLWLLGQGQGVNGMTLALIWMCVLAALGGLYGLVQYRARWLKYTVCIVCATCTAGWFAVFSVVMIPVEDAQLIEGSEQVSAAQGDAPERWQKYDEAAILMDVAAGKVVFVDFTADWCITCKVNEHGVLVDDDLLAQAEAMQVVWYKADWTHRDERIRKILKKYRKGGVPMYLIYGKNLPERGLLLPELLTKDIVLGGLKKAHGS